MMMLLMMMLMGGWKVRMLEPSRFRGTGRHGMTGYPTLEEGTNTTGKVDYWKLPLTLSNLALFSLQRKDRVVDHTPRHARHHRLFVLDSSPLTTSGGRGKSPSAIPKPNLVDHTRKENKEGTARG